MDIHGEPTDAELERERLIAERAFELFEARGGQPGYDQADWFEAEQQLVEEGVIELPVEGLPPEHAARRPRSRPVEQDEE